MATTTSTTGDQPFSRIVETKKTTSWILGVPIAIFVVLAVALIAYFAAKGTQAREELAQVQQAMQQQQAALTQTQQKMSSVDAELSRLRDAGRTTVILQAAAAKKGKASSNAWGAATWGEQQDGKTWLRLSAYGLSSAPTGKNYDLWFASTSGDSILVGKLEPNTDGTAFVAGKDLPAVDQGKAVIVAMDDDNAKTPGQPVFQASLPKLTPSPHAVPAAASDQAGPGNAENAQNESKAQPQGKPGPSKQR